MENDQWQEFVRHLVTAKREIAAAWSILDGTDGAAAGSEHVLGAALDSIDALYAIESSDAFNLDVASPDDVQEFRETHGQLPGFALGT